MSCMCQSLYRLITVLVFSQFGFMAIAETSPSSITNGIEGVIFVSPSRPGPQRIDVPSRAPAPNVTFVVKKENATVASFTTDREGHFQVALPPGHYAVSRDNPGARVGRWNFEADVAAGRVTKVQWTGDSGMR